MGKRRSSFVASDESGDDERPAKQLKVSKKSSSSKSSSGAGGSGVDADGNRYWTLADNDKRRVTINKFSGKWLVNVREYYEDKAGDMKPGKKGISLTIEQYQSLVGIVPAINQQLRKNGVALDGDVIEDDDDDEDDEDEVEKPAKATKKSKKTKVESKKANIEATSDEDDDE